MEENGDNKPDFVFVSEKQVREVLNWDDTIEATEVSLESVSTGKSVQKPRTFTNVQNTKNNLLTMPGYLNNDKFGALGCKLVTAFPSNANLNPKVPVINANIMIFDEITGKLKAVIAGTQITAWRTAAASVVATKHLHKGQKNILAVIGAGVQGRSHSLAFQHYFNFKEVRVWNRTFNRAQKLADELKNLGHNAVALDKVEDCVRDADVVVTATFATEPLVKLAWIKENVHINAVGAGITHHSELEEAVYRNSDIYVDHAPNASKELSGLLDLGLKFKGEIGEIIANKIQAKTGDAITIFHGLGMAVEDCAMARLVYDKIRLR